MSDGVKIAARLWLPDDAEQDPVPAIMDYIPYRKRDSTRLYDETRMPYLASYGYACIRPDIRGAGDSEGLPLDEYVKQEQDDGVEIIAWLAKQPWCTGKVGQYGISWGGFSALQVAARRPPALKAIITHCSTDDRYTDDAHYEGGCIIQDMFVWGAYHTLDGTRPPDPAIVGDRWRDMWMERLNNLDFYVANWFTHQHRDAFWKHASIDEDYSQITCAVYAVGGWVDAYNCAIPRMLAGLKCPRKGLIGPWSHNYPNEGVPGPAIDWLTESLRWWDHWLKGVDTGIMDEPMYRVWMQNEEATLGKREVTGRWVAEDIWPSPRIKASKYYLTAAGVEVRAGVDVAKVLKPRQTVGMTAPHWLAFNPDTEAPTDQRIDDARSLTFDSEALKEGFEILGAPVVTLDLSVDKPVAFLAVRLNEVEPTGESTRITYAVLNLTQRDSREFPTALEPGKRYRIRIPLRDRAHVFKTGNRLRIAVSTTYWPLIWPSPEPVTLTLYAGKSELELPVRPPRSADAALRPFGAAFVPDSSGSTVIEGSVEEPKVFEWNVATKALTEINKRARQRKRLNATGTELLYSGRQVLAIRDDDPTSATLDSEYTTGFKRDDWDVRMDTALRMRLTKSEFLLVGEIKAYERYKEVFSKVWDRKIPRMLL
jgi:putative CocE/NonD family hydrolase